MNNNQNVAETCFLPGFLSWFEAHPVLLSVLWSVSATLIQQICMRTQNVILSGVDRPQRSSNSPSVLELFLGLKKKLTRCRSCPYARIRSSHAAGVVLKLGNEALLGVEAVQFTLGAGAVLGLEKEALLAVGAVQFTPGPGAVLRLGKGALLETGALQITWSVADDVGSSHVNPCVVDQRLFPEGGQIPASSHLKRFPSQPEAISVPAFCGLVGFDSLQSGGKTGRYELVSKSRKWRIRSWNSR